MRMNPTLFDPFVLDTQWQANFLEKKVLVVYRGEYKILK